MSGFATTTHFILGITSPPPTPAPPTKLPFVQMHQLNSDLQSQFLPAILTASTPRSIGSFGKFLERNSSCSDLLGLVIACIIFFFAQVVLIAIWYYLYVKIRHQRMSLVAATKSMEATSRLGTQFDQSIYMPFNGTLGHHFPVHLLHPPAHQIYPESKPSPYIAADVQYDGQTYDTQFLGHPYSATPFPMEQQVYAPTTVYTGTVVRHRRPAHLRSVYGEKSRMGTAMKNRRRSGRDGFKLTSSRKSGLFTQHKTNGFHNFYPYLLPSHLKLVTSDSNDDQSCKTYEMFSCSDADQTAAKSDVNCGETDQETSKKKEVTERRESRRRESSRDVNLDPSGGDRDVYGMY